MPAPVNRLDVESLQRGARNFVNYCLNCHSAKYMRYNRLTDLGIDPSMIQDNLMFATDKVGNSTQSVGVTGSFVELAGVFFTNPVADYTGYFGGGFSWGISHVQESGTSYTGSGLQGNAMAGIEMFRSSTMRLFVQADAQLPFYQSTVDFCSFMVNCPRDTRYTPAFWASVGIGWGKANTIGVVQR